MSVVQGSYLLLNGLIVWKIFLNLFKLHTAIMLLAIMRDQFLNNEWIKYPAMTPDIQFAGRVLQIDTKNRVLLVSGQTVKLSAEVEVGPSKVKKMISNVEDILREGDLVGFFSPLQNTQSAVCLFSPCLQEISLQPESKKVLLGEWSQFQEKIKAFFKVKNFFEIQTPTLVPCPGTEPYIETFSTELKHGKKKTQLFLPTSPELHLKKALSYGYNNIFEMRSCFRNAEFSKLHECEFLMLEWYRAFASLHEIKADLIELFQFLLPEKKWQFSTLTMQQAFRNVLNFDLQASTSREQLIGLAKKLGLSVNENDPIDEIFNFIFVEKVEPKLYTEQPFFLEKYPPFHAAYARLTKDGWADRFELYWKGVELANAFHEVNDPGLQNERMRMDLQKKELLGFTKLNMDEEFIRCLRYGMPPSGGIALGVDRLFMLMQGVQSIQDFRLFPYWNFFQN